MAGHGRAGDVRPAVPPRGSGSPLTNVVYPHFDALAAASACIGSTIAPTSRRTWDASAPTGSSTSSADRENSSSLRLSARTSEQLAARTEEEVPTLEGLLHQIEVRIDPALTKSYFRPAVAIDRQNEVSVGALENVLTNALRRQ